jgi:hypothetical protein
MYMPLVEEQPDSRLSAQQQAQGQLPFRHHQQHRPALPAPRGLGLGLTRHAHSGRHYGGWGQQQQALEQEVQTLEMFEDAAGQGEDAAADMDFSAGVDAETAAAGAPAAAAIGHTGFYDADEAVAMAVDSAKAAAEGVFVDAEEVGLDDLACEGLPGDNFASTAAAAAAGGSPGSGGGFIFLRGSDEVGGVFEAVNVPRVGRGGDVRDDDMQVVGHGLMQLQFNG